MFGSNYANYTPLLIHSFGKMNTTYYRKTKRIPFLRFRAFLHKIYVSLFGIPEIGLQVRSLNFQHVVHAYLKNMRFRKILDAGSGIGMYTLYLAKEYPCADVVGWDIDRHKLQICKKILRQLSIDNVLYKNCNLVKDKIKTNEFDFIVNIDVLEHVSDYNKVLRRFYRILKKRGMLYIHTPQPNQKRYFPESLSWKHTDHVNEGFSARDLKKTLRKIGFQVIYERHTFGTLGSLAWEINHISLARSMLLAGILYPFLILLIRLDHLRKSERGLGVAILAKKT